jgi:hypothetical protein
MPRKKTCQSCEVLREQVKFLQGMLDKFISYQCPTGSGVTDDAATKPSLSKYENYIAQITGVPDDELEMGNQRPQ